ncbi:hypothetical protein HPB52_010231 [Rhipicephalus sanguineus]|uniref:Uncharacterized protein n=1 Tax=Rhipicephalus sanguineus TaxID=34632 RepID=A0A9D4PZ40_RHISA|nr:hypothetical protein HPB52_010231 [Rhipicephalus sanguineus]
MASLQTAYRALPSDDTEPEGAHESHYLIHTVPDSSPTNVCDSRGNRNSPLSSYHMNHTHMNIDENGEFSIGSDHNRIKLSFSRSSWRTIAKEHRNPAERHLPQSEYAAVAEAFEQNFQPTEPPTYDQFVLELRSIMKKHEIRVNSRGGLRRKGWWDEEEEMDDAAEASVSVPTYADVLCYVDHIRRFACARDEIGDLLPDVAAIERKLMLV